jgi:hypothetical protein
VRASFPVERLIAMAEELAASESEDTRKWALTWLSERGHGKVADKMELGPAGSMQDDDDELADSMTLEELDALDRLDEQRARILDAARARTTTPAVVLTAGDSDEVE